MELIDNSKREDSKCIFQLTSFPATCGDSFWLTYGNLDDQYHILIDGGTASGDENIKKHILELPKDSELELVIVTHYDSDHIEGIRKLLDVEELPINIKEIWFNSYDKLDTSLELESFGAIMGEQLSLLIEKHKIQLNKSFGEKAVVIENDSESLPTIQLPGGLILTLLSPYQKQLSELKPVWEKEVREAGKQAGYGSKVEIDDLEIFGVSGPAFDSLSDKAFSKDTSKGNGSSIAVLAEFNKKSILFLGDAFSEVIMKSLDLLQIDKVTLLKVSHHGGSKNTDPKLIEQLDCNHYLFSTNGNARPTTQTLAYILKSKKKATFYFNYLEQKAKEWENELSMLEYGYKTQYPKDTTLSINILELDE